MLQLGLSALSWAAISGPTAHISELVALGALVSTSDNVRNEGGPLLRIHDLMTGSAQRGPAPIMVRAERNDAADACRTCR
jgi:hypothetical protein